MGHESRIVSEYYFEYKIEKVFSDDESIETPKLYFERDFIDLSQYVLYTVAEEWRDKEKLVKLIKKSNLSQDLKNRTDDAAIQNKKTSNTFWRIISKDGKSISAIRDLLPYDKVTLSYNTHGTDAGVFTNANEKERKKFVVNGKSQNLDDFWNNGCRLNLLKGESVNYSGVGQIEYSKFGEVKAKFFFAVNYAIRKKINYTLTHTKSNVNLKFECDNAPVGIKVGLLAASGRLPCLRDDTKQKVVELKFNKKNSDNKYTFEIDIPVERVTNDVMYFLTFDDVDMERYYLLSCKSNSTIAKPSPVKAITGRDSCPYCHSLIPKDVHYKKGGVSCQGEQTPTTGNQPITLYEKRKLQESKNAIYCAGDLNDKGFIDSDFRRTLPKDFFSHNSFKVAFTGSWRAGKTTYISRLFNINKNGIDKDITAIALNMIKKPLERLNIGVNHAPIQKISVSDKEVKGKGKVDVIDDINWATNDKYYGDRAIDLKLGMFPTGTQTGLEFTKYPFCIEAKKLSDKNGASSYVSFYDVAGEDAAAGPGNILTIAGRGAKEKKPIGIFLLVNGSRGENANSSIIDDLVGIAETKENKDGISPDCPIAVILTKMDILKEEFDGNCHCLRSDYLNYSFEKYDGSYLEQEINTSSEEVRSYLHQVDPVTLSIESAFNNIKYFALSSFNYSDCIIHKENENENDPGELKFESSGFRLELPVVWMLRQFGIID